MKIKKFKTVIFTLACALVIVSVTACNESGCSDIYYTDDYPEIYSETIKIMFGEDYTVSAPENCSREIEECCEPTAGIKFYTSWNITYYDGNGDRQVFYFDNAMPLSHWIEQHANEQIKKYYSKLYDEAFEEIPLFQYSSLYADLARIASYITGIPEIPDMYDRTRYYTENLSTPEGCIKFCELTERNAFTMMPLHLKIHVFINTEYLSASQISEYRQMAETAAENFIIELNTVTDNSMNISLLIDDDNNKDTRKYYIHGKEIDTDSSHYEKEVFESYEDEFYS
ncbi:MAG: hypothetical protein ACI4JB_03185 [Porcipelethomonas sp.]